MQPNSKIKYKYTTSPQKPQKGHKEDYTYKKTTLNLFKKYSNYMENPWEKYNSKGHHGHSKSVDNGHSKQSLYKSVPKWVKFLCDPL